jgi:hypothetical protein
VFGQSRNSEDTPPVKSVCSDLMSLYPTIESLAGHGPDSTLSVGSNVSDGRAVGSVVMDG